jgi:Zn-finger nucleic acid-binding protein
VIIECPGCKSRYDVTGRAPGTPLRCRCGKGFSVPKENRESAAMSCPQCGAPASPTSDRCRYCDATLALIRCPSCFGKAFLGSKFCPFCSSALDAPARPIESVEREIPRRCPRCAGRSTAALVAHLAGDVLLDECTHCGGIFVETRTFDRLVADREKRSELFAALDPGRTAAAPEPMQNATVSYLRCPDCENLMNRMNFGRRSGVIIDVCKVHGIWFDRDELRRVLEFVQSGGLEETRRREIEELKAQAFNRKMEAAMHPASSHDMDHRYRHDDDLIAVGVEAVVDALLSFWR